MGKITWTNKKSVVLPFYHTVSQTLKAFASRFIIPVVLKKTYFRLSRLTPFEARKKQICYNAQGKNCKL